MIKFPHNHGLITHWTMSWWNVRIYGASFSFLHGRFRSSTLVAASAMFVWSSCIQNAWDDLLVGTEEECMLPYCPLFPGRSYQEVWVSLSNYALIKISPTKTRKRSHDHAMLDIVAKDSIMGLTLLEIISNCVIGVSWDLINLVGLGVFK